MVEEAEARASSADQRAREITTQVTQQRQSAQQEAEAMVARARREAEQIVSAAQNQADSIRESSAAAAQKELGDIRTEVEQLTRRRDAISAQLTSLRDVVAGFSEQPE